MPAAPAGAAGHGPAVGDATASDLRSRTRLAWLLGGALAARAALSIADAWSLSAHGVHFVPLNTVGVAVGSDAAFVGFLWGSVALIAAVTLVRRLRFGWLLGVAVCLVYLLQGIGNLALLRSESTLPLDAWFFFLLDLAMPALVLAGLFAARPWLLGSARRPARPRKEGARPRARPSP